MSRQYNVISFFAGVGGIDLGFEQSGSFATVYANEFDKDAQETFAANFSPKLLDRRDIREVDPQKGLLGEVQADVLLAGFPCQAFSIAGYRKGFKDDRGDLFFETMRIVSEKQPAVVFLENVKNLIPHDGGNTFKVIREFLVHMGYHIKWAVLNAKDYGNLPQNRERIYIVGFKDPKAYAQFKFPEEIECKTTLRDVIDFAASPDERYYYRKNKQSFYDQLEEKITSQDTVYQWRRQYVRENKSGVVPTLTANMGTGGHNVPLILTDNKEIRKLTPRETFNVQGYPEDFILPAKIANTQLYKQAGNSVAVPVIRRIAEQINVALKGTKIDAPLPKVKNLFAVIFTHMEGTMVGESYPVAFFNSSEGRNKWVKEYLSGNQQEFAEVPIYNNDDFYRSVKRRSEDSFLSLIG
ncbi:DNA cytosine methyltransferase [Rothia sp. P7181]|uniref:DNA cytosine methyltransferase n=1 Tax=Rothia sp. P7181 TaxID=3402663 RepID=UPI003ADE514D